ncbi:MAG: hypothetical protein HUU16_18700, partial [Candidatus Omnitrophica bacterium]|nr:hypothetical protein [Candidatus Omnitrophota bacterium]
MILRICLPLLVGIALSLPRTAVAQENPPAEGESAAVPSDLAESIPSFLTEADYSVDEGVWSDEFEDGKPGNAWFAYDINYFANPDTAAKQDPRVPHEQATIYDDPIKAQEKEGVLLVSGGIPMQVGGGEATTRFAPTELKRYKVITPDPIQGGFRAEIKIAIRGRTFQAANVLFFVREHDWKFDGAREGRVNIAIQYPSPDPSEPAAVRYAGDWQQLEHFTAQDRIDDLRAEDSLTVELRRAEGDNQITWWTAEDEADLELRGTLGPTIDTDFVDILLGIQTDPIPGQEGSALAIDSFTIRGPQVPDVDEGTEDQTLRDYRETARSEYELDAQGRFDYSEAALLANRAYTWMHFFGYNQQYPPGTLQARQQVQQQPGAPGQPFVPPPQFPGQPGFPGQFPQPGAAVGPVQPGSEQEKQLHGTLDLQGYPRGNRTYLDEAEKVYKLAGEKDPVYQTIHRQIEWVRTVAYDRILRLMHVFRARTADSIFTGPTELRGTQSVLKGLDELVGDETSRNPYDSRIRIFEGKLSPEVKTQVLNYPEAAAVALIYQYLGVE